MPFAPHVGTDPLGAPETSTFADLTGLIKANKGLQSEPAFWVAYQLGTFQGHISQSNDPNHGGDVVYGHSTTGANTEGDTGSAVFAEVIRDSVENDDTVTTSIENLRRLTSIHELGHLFGLEDGKADGLLMDVDETTTANSDAKVKSLMFSGRGIRRIMITRQPGHAPH